MEDSQYGQLHFQIFGPVVSSGKLCSVQGALISDPESAINATSLKYFMSRCERSGLYSLYTFFIILVKF